jgi:hypothetical protein
VWGQLPSETYPFVLEKRLAAGGQDRFLWPSSGRPRELLGSCEDGRLPSGGKDILCFDVASVLRPRVS